MALDPGPSAAMLTQRGLSPNDLFPDFIPILGYLDDLVLNPLFILIARRLIPPEIVAEHRERVQAQNNARSSRAAAIIIVSIWVFAILVGALLLWRRLG